MAKDRRKFLLPFWGYVVLNLVMAGFLAVIYQVTAWTLAPLANPPIPPFGLAAILIICWISFLVASIIDAVSDRVSRRHPAAPAQSASLPGGASKETIPKSAG